MFKVIITTVGNPDYNQDPIAGTWATYAEVDAGAPSND